MGLFNVRDTKTEVVSLVIPSRSASGVLTPRKGLNLHGEVCHDLFLSDGNRAGLTGGSAVEGRAEASFCRGVSAFY